MRSRRCEALACPTAVCGAEPLATLKQLEQIVVPDNRLLSVPPWIGTMTNLRVLDVGGNPLEALPRELSGLSRLTHLVAWGTELHGIPPALRALRNLTWLDLSCDGATGIERIAELDRQAEGFGFYRTTGMSGHRGPFKEIPEWFAASLPELRELRLGGHALHALPAALPLRLVSLFLGGNDLSEFPPAVFDLPALRHLDLRDNHISTLPEHLNALSGLRYLALAGNPLPIPPEVLVETRSPVAFAQYVADVQGPTRRLDEAKLLVVGEGAVGKTSLIRRLTDCGFAADEAKTEGIEVSQMSILADDEPVQLNVWDFGGQEIMHATHQFFLTKRSACTCWWWTPARGEQRGPRRVLAASASRASADDSPVIVVANKCEPLVLDMDARGLRAKYANIVGIVPVSCKVAAGLDQVLALLVTSIERMDHVRDVLPASYFEVKRELEHLDADYLSYADYQAICVRQGVDLRTNQEILVRFLHDLGTVLCFRDDRRLSDTNILNPSWVTGWRLPDLELEPCCSAQRAAGMGGRRRDPRHRRLSDRTTDVHRRHDEALRAVLRDGRDLPRPRSPDEGGAGHSLVGRRAVLRDPLRRAPVEHRVAACDRAHERVDQQGHRVAHRTRSRAGWKPRACEERRRGRHPQHPRHGPGQRPSWPPHRHPDRAARDRSERSGPRRAGARAGARASWPLGALSQAA